MRKIALLSAACLLSTGSAAAQLMPYEDYDVSEAVWEVTLVKVDANKGDDYLEGLQQTWIASQEIAKELGQIEDYFVYGSALPQAGDFNMMLVTKMSSMSDMSPSEERFDAFMERWGEERMQMSREVSANYPELREIKGSYLMHQIDLPPPSSQRRQR